MLESSGAPPALAVLTHVDSEFGNLSDAKAVGEICRSYGVPLLLNAALTAGRMPISCSELGADFLVASGHKSMAACGPVGVLAARGELADKVFAKSRIKPELSPFYRGGFPNKEVEMLGCTVRGAPLITLMASFPYVAERVKRWEAEVAKARRFVELMERIEGVRQLGQRPRRHDICDFEAEPFYQISLKHKRRGYFLYEELKQRGIVGIAPGKTKRFHVSVYGLSDEEVEEVARAFQEVAEKYGVRVS